MSDETVRTRQIRSVFNLLGLPEDAYYRPLTPDEHTRAYQIAQRAEPETKSLIIEALLQVHSKHQEHIAKSSFDPLTMLMKREVFDRVFERVLEQRRRVGGQIALGVLDIDHFKKFNDTYGHLIGDDVLAATGQRLLSCVRANDHTGRFGGEELVFLMENGNGPDGLREPIRRVRETMRRFTATDRDGQEHTIGTSIGVAIVNQEAAKKLSTSQIFQWADTVLYHVKTHGRGDLKYINVPPRPVPRRPANDVVVDAAVPPAPGEPQQG